MVLQEPRGTETVLVVDDERLVLRMVSRILEAHGYTVLCSDSGERALELQAGFEGPIHLLVTDVMMPGMNGKQLHDALRVLRPEIRTLFISGFSGAIFSHPSKLEKGVGYMQKPFTLHDLTHRVRQLLDR